MLHALQDALKEIFHNLGDGSHYRTQRIDGVVTKVCESQGLAVIDHEIYMDLSITALGGKQIRLGDHHILNVKRRSKEDAWTVDQADIIGRKSSVLNDDGIRNSIQQSYYSRK